MAYIDLSTPPLTAGTGPTPAQASGVRASLGLPTFVILTPVAYAALVNSGTTNADTIYIIQE